MFAQVKLSKIKQLPVRTISFSDCSEVARHDRIVELVKSILNLHDALEKPHTGHKRTVLERQIEATDREIDRLVYELYGLTEEEIRIVEKSVGGA